MKAILIPIHPEWVAKILNGEKTVEIRKTMPQCELPIDVYIYCTKSGRELYFDKKQFGCYSKSLHDDDLAYEYVMGLEPLNGKVVAKFTLRKVEKLERYTGVYIPETILHTDSIHTRYSMEKKSCLSMDEIWEYTNGNGYAWHISDLVIFDQPKELSDFEKVGSYSNPTIRCKKKEQGRCNYGKSPFTWKWVGCEKARLTKAPQSWCYVEV